MVSGAAPAQSRDYTGDRGTWHTPCQVRLPLGPVPKPRVSPRDRERASRPDQRFGQTLARHRVVTRDTNTAELCVSVAFISATPVSPAWRGSLLPLLIYGREEVSISLAEGESLIGDHVVHLLNPAHIQPRVMDFEMTIMTNQNASFDFFFGCFYCHRDEVSAI